MSKFKNKVVVITGAGAGLGKTLAENFAREGAKLSLVDINEKALEELAKELDMGENCLICRADVSKEADVIEYVSRTKERFGQIDVFCNNAGIDIPCFIRDTKEETLDKVFGINFKGMFLGMKHVIPVMEEKRSGVIMNTGSISSYGADAEDALYCASKAAVLSLSKCAALEEGPYGIRVNTICPGPMKTAMMTEFAMHSCPEDPEGFIKSLAESVPLGRYAETQDVANVYLFMASDEAAYMTGTKVVVDGGATHE